MSTSKLLAFFIILVCLPQLFAVQVLCGDYNIEFVRSSKCLTNEFAVFINDAWLACLVGNDSFLSHTTQIINTMCNSNNANFTSSYPNQVITCSGHIIQFIPNTDACLSNEFNVVIDDVSFICIPDDDSYSTNVMDVLGAFCSFGSNEIKVRN